MVNYDISKVIGAIPEIIKGLPMTLLVLLLTTILGSLLGGLVAWASLSRIKLLKIWLRVMFLSYVVLHLLYCCSWYSMEFLNFLIGG